jgi:hypothetical protein
MRHALRHPDVLAVARDPRLPNIARQILGCDPLPFRRTLFDKSLVSNWLVVWHQDTALPLRERRNIPEWGPWSVKDGVIDTRAPAHALSTVIGLRLHLDDSVAEKRAVARSPRNTRDGCTERRDASGLKCSNHTGKLLGSTRRSARYETPERSRFVKVEHPGCGGACCTSNMPLLSHLRVASNSPRANAHPG